MTCVPHRRSVPRERKPVGKSLVSSVGEELSVPMRRLRPMTVLSKLKRVAVRVQEVTVVAIGVFGDDGGDEAHFAFGIQAVAKVKLAGDVGKVGVEAPSYLPPSN